MPGAQVDMVIERNDGIIHLCEAKLTTNEFIISKEYAASLRQKRAIFQYVTQTKKGGFHHMANDLPCHSKQVL